MKFSADRTRLVTLALVLTMMGAPTFLKGAQRRKPPMSGQVTEGFQLSATADVEEVTSGQPIRLRIVIKNVTKKPLYLAEVGVEKDYSLSISNDKRIDVPLTEHGKAVLDGDVYMNLSLIVKPGEERRDVLEVNNLYDMTAPGEYSILVQRKVGRLNAKGTAQVQSNVVHVRVISRK